MNWNDHGWRNYDPQLGRFHAIDAHAETYDGWTPYNYAANNPVLITDPTGLDWYLDKDGNQVQLKGAIGDIEGYTWLNADNTSVQLAEVTVTAKKTDHNRLRDAANQLGIYEGRRKFNEAFMGAIGVIPGGDTFADANSLAQDLGNGNYKSATFSAAMLILPGISATSAKQVHHLIPKELRRGGKGTDIRDFIAKARSAGFKFEGQMNKMSLDTYNATTGMGVHASHKNYNQYVTDKISDIINQAGGITSITPQQAAAELQNLSNNLRGQIQTLINNGLSTTPYKNLNTEF